MGNRTIKAYINLSENKVIDEKNKEKRQAITPNETNHI
jgi:hypothetical protein